MKIEIPDNLAHELGEIAATQRKSLEQFAVESLKSLVERPTSPDALIRILRALPHPSPEAVDEMEAAIAASRQPVRDEGIFDTESTK